MRYPATIRTRTTLGAAVIVGLALLGFGVGLTLVVRSAMTEQVDETLNVRAGDLVMAIGTAGDAGAVPLGDGEDSFTQIVASDGTVRAASPTIVGMAPITTAAPGTYADLPGRVAGTEHLRFHVRDGPGDEAIVVATTLEGVDDIVEVVKLSLWLGLPVLLVLVTAATWVVTGRALAPVEAIRAEVADISPAELHRRVPQPPVHDEIGRLAGTMNHMLDRLDRANDRQRRFVSDASHELRTPIATIRHQLEVALDEHAPDWPDIAGEVLEEDLRMQRMVEDLLWLANHDRVESATATRREQLVDLDEVAFDEARRQRAAGSLRAGDVLIDTSAIQAGQVRGHADELRRAVRNLVDNAHRYAAHDIAITVTTQENLVVLAVDDDGPGVEPEDRERIFERFTRADEARSRDDGGIGLGLAIAHEIVTAHGGTIEVSDSSALGGARFSLALPSTRSAGRRAADKQPDGSANRSTTQTSRGVGRR